MMYKKIIRSYLSGVIPKISTNKELFTLSFLLGLSAYLFLIVFQPFGTYNFDHIHKFVLLSGYGAILSAAYILVSLVLRTKIETIAMELFRITLVLLVTSFCNFIYHGWIINGTPLQWGNLPYIGFYTLSLYSPIGTIYFLLRINRYSPHPIQNNPLNVVIPINSDAISNQGNDCHFLTLVRIPNGSQTLTLRPDDFIFGKSMDNYCMIYFRKDDTLKKQMIRITLTHLSQLLHTGAIHRCHRSYLVNFEKVLVKERNAQGFLLRFADIEDFAIVSRSAIESVRPYL